jgi:hypothetical protein
MVWSLALGEDVEAAGSVQKHVLAARVGLSPLEHLDAKFSVIPALLRSTLGFLGEPLWCQRSFC